MRSAATPTSCARTCAGSASAALLITFILALAHVVIWYPAEILDTAAGYVYGFWAGLALVMAGWLVNALLAYWIGRHAARPVLYRFVSHERFDRLERMVETGGVTLLLGIRLVPVIPFSLFSMAAGAARADLFTFVWTTVVGYLPITAFFVYLGSRLETLSPTDPILWIGAAVLIGLLVLTRRFHRRWRREAAQARNLIDRGLDLLERWASRSAARWPPGPDTTTAGSAGSLSCAASIASLRGPAPPLAGSSKSSSHCSGIELRHGLGHLAQVGRRRSRASSSSRWLRTNVSRYCHWRDCSRCGLGCDRRQGGVVGREREVAELEPRVAGARVALDQRVDRHRSRTRRRERTGCR